MIDGRSGLLCDAKNAGSLYFMMKKMMALSREERTEMGRAGRKHMEGTFDKKAVVMDTIRQLI